MIQEISGHESLGELQKYLEVRDEQLEEASPNCDENRFLDWPAYDWAFADPQQPLVQGQRAQRQGHPFNDMAFRPALTELRTAWEKITGGLKNSANGSL